MHKPNLYLSANELQRRDTSEFIDEFEEEFSKMSGHCLDVGSGPGDVVNDLVLPKVSQGSTIVCSDISMPMLDFGTEKYKENERLSFVKLDIESPDLPEDLVGQFDHVTSFYCIHFCQDYRTVFENIFRVLRPGGTAFLTFVARYPGFEAYVTLATLERYRPYMQDAARFIPVFQQSEQPRKTLRTLLKDVGFEIQHCSCREMSYVYETLNNLSNFIVAINPFIQRIPVDLVEDYTKDLVQEAAKHNIALKKNNDKTWDEYSILSRYQTFIVYLRKPSSN